MYKNTPCLELKKFLEQFESEQQIQINLTDRCFFYYFLTLLRIPLRSLVFFYMIALSVVR